ncbi:MAG: alpha/beta hydrolase [Opitutaceae bacterium]|nr:alpha/beta hydrolase [Opitutaceae bacterium]
MRMLMLPGYGNSGPGHWQTLWEQRLPGSARVDFQTWDQPDARGWGRTLQEALDASAEPSLLIAHSLACLLVAGHIASRGSAGIAGAFLVAPPDPRHAAFPPAITGFSTLAGVPLQVPALVVSSTDDPYSDAGFGARCARTWGAGHHLLERAGHIHAASGHGPWPEGLRLLLEFARTLDPGCEN